MKKFKFLFFLPLLFATSLHAAELYTTAVQKGLSDMLNPSGKFTTLRFSDGTSQSSAGLTSFILGTNTTGILPITQGGTGTNTATLDGFAHTGTSTFPSGVWGNTGNVGIGTTTPTTELHVIGTVTATDFSGNGSQLTGISSGEVGSWTSVGGLLYPKTISDNVGVGTTTPVTTLQVIGTVTASGFSGNGAGLTGISATVAFSAVTGSATASQLPLVTRLPATTTSQVAQSYAQLYNYSTTGLFNGTVTITGGTATASSTATGSAANAFDGSTTTLWESNAGLPQWVQYQFPEALNMNTIRCYNYANELAGTYTVSASNNGSDFYTIGLFTHGTTTDNTGVTNTFGTTTNYSYWRVTAPLGAGDSSTMGIRDIEFGGLTTYPAYNVTIVPNDRAVALFTIQAPGSTSTQASYIYNNVTTTFWGLGTNTSIPGTTSGAYAGWSDRPIRVTAVDIGSTEKIKENIKTIKIKPDWLDAEDMAKKNYIAGAKAAWMAANQASYEIIVNETGTGSVAYVDLPAMESDYNNHIELEWAADMNQDVYAENVQKQHEKGFWQMYNLVTPKSWNPKNNPDATYEGFVVEEMPPVVWGEDGQSLNMMSVVAYMALVQQTLKADTIFALSTLKELITTGTVTQQKIDYVNDRLEVLNP